jgi:hypothetical protein
MVIFKLIFQLNDLLRIETNKNLILVILRLFRLNCIQIGLYKKSVVNLSENEVILI